MFWIFFMIFPPKPGNPSQVTRNSVSFRACPQHNFKLSKSKERTCRNTSSLHNRRFMSQARRTRHLLEARNECEAQDERWRKIKLYFSPPLAWLIKRLLCRLEVFLQVLSLLFFCCRDCCKVGNSGITNLLRKHLCLKYFGEYYTTLNQKLWWMSFTASQHMHVSRPIQIYKSNKARRSVLWKVYIFFLPKQRPKTEAIEYFVTVC